MRGLYKAGLIFAPVFASAIHVNTELAARAVTSPLIHIATDAEGILVLNYPAGEEYDFVAAEIKIPSKKSPDEECLDFDVKILTSERKCDYGNILINGEQLAQESKDGNKDKSSSSILGSDRGSITVDRESPVKANWYFNCLTAPAPLDQELAQLILQFSVQDIAGKPFKNVKDFGVTLSYKQTGSTEIIRLESTVLHDAATDSLESGRDEHGHELFQDEKEFPEFDLEGEMMEIESLRAKVAHLMSIIDQKERAMEEHRMQNDDKKIEDDIKKCDSLKCIMRLTLEKARGAAHIVYGKISGEGFFEGFDGPHGWPHPPHFGGKNPFHGPKNGSCNGNSTHPPPPRFGRPGHGGPDEHHGPPPPHHGHHGPPPPPPPPHHGPPPPHHGPPPPFPPPPHHFPPPPHDGPPPPPFDDGEGFHGPPHHHRPPPPFGDDHEDGPPPFDDGEGFHGPPHHHRPPPPFGDDHEDGPPPFDDGEGFHGPPHHHRPPPPFGDDHEDGPPPPPFDHEDHPHQEHGPPPPSREEQDSSPAPDHEGSPPQHSLTHEDPKNAPPIPILETIVKAITPNPHPPHGPPPHGPHHRPHALRILFHISYFLAGGFMFSILLLTLHRRHLRNARLANRQPNFLCRFISARFGTNSRDDRDDSDYDEKFELDSDGGMDSDITQLSNAASVVGDIVAAEEGRFVTPSSPSQQHQSLAHFVPTRIDSLPGYRFGMGMPGIEEDELPAYEDNDGSEESEGLVSDGFRYAGPGSEYTPEGSETSSLHEILGAPKN